MSFYGDSTNTEPPKQHRINLSKMAVDVLESDKLAFAQNGKIIRDQELRNIIIHNYYKEADASIERRVSQYLTELSELLTPLPSVTQEIKNDICKVLIEEKKKRLKEKVSQYKKEKTESRQFTLNDDNYRYFACDDEDDEGMRCEEDEHYEGRLSQYLKSLIEEYVRLPYVKREEIYLKPQFQLIRQAIESEVQLKITTVKGNSYYIYPYQICTDPLVTANYLVGYSKPCDVIEAELRVATFRIAALKDIKKTRKHAFLTKEQKGRLDNGLKTRGVQFMYRQETEICVKLTDVGWQKYQRQLHLRPVISKKLEDNIYVFSCTPDQAEFYFFKFGKDAEIISPLSLRERLATLYKEASNLYTKSELALC